MSSAIKEVGPTFFLATAMFGFVFQMTSLIAEKELKLREVSNFKLQLIKLNDGLTCLAQLFGRLLVSPPGNDDDGSL